MNGDSRKRRIWGHSTVAAADMMVPILLLNFSIWKGAVISFVALLIRSSTSPPVTGAGSSSGSRAAGGLLAYLSRNKAVAAGLGSLDIQDSQVVSTPARNATVKVGGRISFKLEYPMVEK